MASRRAGSQAGVDVNFRPGAGVRAAGPAGGGAAGERPPARAAGCLEVAGLNGVFVWRGCWGRQRPTWRRRCRRVRALEAPASSPTEEGRAWRRAGRRPKGGSAPGPARPGRPRCAEGARREAREECAGSPPPPHPVPIFAERHAAPNRAFPGGDLNARCPRRGGGRGPGEALGVRSRRTR